MQAKDIPDNDILDHIHRLSTGNHWPWENHGGVHWVFTGELCELYPAVPRKVVEAKLKQLKKRGLLDGCGCGCRGDWELTQKGYDLLVCTCS